MENINDKNLIIFSSRTGGPYRQHSLLCKYLLNEGYQIEHWSGFWRWVLLHFIYSKNTKILTNVPFMFRFKKSDYYLNIHGNYNSEKSISNPLGYLYQFNLRWADKVIVPNDFLKSILKIPESMVVPNFTEEINIPKSSKKGDEIKLITVTNFSFKDKALGVVHIIKALSLLKTGKKVLLNIYGEGKFLNEIKLQSAKIQLPGNIKFCFCGYSKNVLNKMSESDVFVYWSNLDVSPVCFTEAMGCGLPIVVNNYPAFMKCIPKINSFCSNEEEFSRAIKAMIENKSLVKKIVKENKLFYKKLVLSKTNILEKWKSILFYEN